MPQFTALPASSVASGASKTVDVDCRRVRTLTVIWRLLGTTTVGDLTLNDALPMLQDGTVIPVGLAAVTSVAPVSDGVPSPGDFTWPTATPSSTPPTRRRATTRAVTW
jgi:hypothetical protein